VVAVADKKRYKSVEDLLSDLSKDKQCVVEIKDNNWRDKFVRVERSLGIRNHGWYAALADNSDDVLICLLH
jgi:hypothetical protein